jgi:hypothetical protein
MYELLFPLNTNSSASKIKKLHFDFSIHTVNSNSSSSHTGTNVYFTIACFVQFLVASEEQTRYCCWRRRLARHGELQGSLGRAAGVRGASRIATCCAATCCTALATRRQTAAADHCEMFIACVPCISVEQFVHLVNAPMFNYDDHNSWYGVNGSDDWNLKEKALRNKPDGSWPRLAPPGLPRLLPLLLSGVRDSAAVGARGTRVGLIDHGGREEHLWDCHGCRLWSLRWFWEGWQPIQWHGHIRHLMNWNWQHGVRKSRYIYMS